MQAKDKLMKVNMETMDEELESLRDSLQSLHQRSLDSIRKWLKKGNSRTSASETMYFGTESTSDCVCLGYSFEVHGPRSKYYNDASMDIDEEILEHVAKQGIVLGVECFRDHRYNTETKKWELLVSWRGQQHIEDSWEPLQAMQCDVPNLMADYAEHKDGEVFHAQLNEACHPQSTIPPRCYIFKSGRLWGGSVAALADPVSVAMHVANPCTKHKLVLELLECVF
ncbi:hypothetical protein PHMEG_00025007 [Phytophthora megakarya]|uniref:Chromo domain-containing protein n=1 Tax=Phytophthora megakarya TaxID=4795 RepID=A0A225VEI3_9STRA|nr:hypothetical protein PHMEG_00025007 [Phytophthora megakarya]